MNDSKTWEEVDFRKEVLGFVMTDDRFAGMAEYLSQVKICWSYVTPSATATSGFMFFNPDWWDMLPEETRKAAVFHQAYALVSQHAQRKEGKQPVVFSAASQFVINPIVKEAGFTNEGWDWLYNEEYIGMSVEEVYLNLMEGEVYIPPAVLQNELTAEMYEEMMEDIFEDLDEDLEDFLAEDAIRSREAGAGLGIGATTGTIGLDLNIGTGTEVIVGATYEDILAPYMEVPPDTEKRSYRRPSRRSTNGDFIRPGKVKKKGGAPERLKHIFLLLDVSGSISVEQGKQFNYSAQTIKKTLDPELMTVMFFDTQIKLEKTFSASEAYSPLKVRAGGGTDLRQPYKRIKEIEPEMVMIFTDLQVVIPPEPDWDTIWLVPEKGCHIPDSLYGNVYLIPKRERPS